MTEASGTAAPLAWGSVYEAARRRSWDGRPLGGVTDDSRSVRPGAIFVARRGFATDGHAFVDEARAAGAAIVVSERAVATGLPTCLVPDGRRALSELADAWYGQPSRHMRVVGVTGTNGKTTTTWLVASILRAAGMRACTIGTLGAGFGGRRRIHVPWTTPPAPELHRLLAEALAGGADAAVIEVSAQAASQQRVADCAFDAAAITNVSREHGEYFADATDYRRAKIELFRLLGHGGKRAQAVLNVQLPHLDEFQAACSVPWIGFGRGGDVEALWARTLGLRGTDLLLRLPGPADHPQARRLRLHLPGAHNVENALCAAAIGLALGVPHAAIVDGLGRLRRIPGRMTFVQRRPFLAVVDYAHNPAGLRSVLGPLRQATPGRLVIVMGARGRRERGKRSLMGAVAAAYSDLVILTADRPAGEDPAEAVAPMRASAVDIGVPVLFEPDRFRALERAVEGAAAGDCVVVVGKGEEPWGPDDTSEGRPMDDVAGLRRLLAAKAGDSTLADAVWI